MFNNSSLFDISSSLLIYSQVKFVEDLGKKYPLGSVNQANSSPTLSTASLLTQGATANPMLNQLESQMETAESAIEGINKIAVELDESLSLVNKLKTVAEDNEQKVSLLERLDEIKSSFKDISEKLSQYDSQVGNNFMDNKIHQSMKEAAHIAETLFANTDFENEEPNLISSKIEKAKMNILGISAEFQDTLHTLSKSVINVSRVQNAYQSALPPQNFAKAFTTSDLYSLSTARATAGFTGDQNKYIGNALDFVS